MQKMDQGHELPAGSGSAQNSGGNRRRDDASPKVAGGEGIALQDGLQNRDGMLQN